MDDILELDKPLVLTPQYFETVMRDIAQGVDLEEEHGKADKLMCDLLTALGYGEGIAVYIKMKKWYA